MPKEEHGVALDDNINYYANKLAELLADSDEFKSYNIARENLQKDKNFSYLLADCRQRQLQLHLAALTGDEATDETQECENLYATLVKEPIISDFLSAEARFYTLLTKVQQILGKDLVLWSEGEVAPVNTNQILN